MTSRLKSGKAALAICRVAFSIVFAINVYCAIVFIARPVEYVGAYELDGVPGMVAIQAMGIVFLMWNATYPPFIAKPARNRILGAVIIAQQSIGCIGEIWILATLGEGHEILASSIERFIVFDAFGLALEAIVYALLLAKIPAIRSSSNEVADLKED